MRIIISPAKQMRIDTDLFTCSELPVFTEKTEILMRWIQSLSYEEQKKPCGPATTSSPGRMPSGLRIWTFERI